MSGNQLAYVEFLCTFVVGLLPSEMRKELLSNKHNIDDHVTVSDESFALLILWNIEDTNERINQDHLSDNVSVASFKSYSNNMSKVSGSEGKIGWNERALRKYSEIHRKVEKERNTHNRGDIYTQVHRKMTTDHASKLTKSCKKGKKKFFSLDDDVR